MFEVNTENIEFFGYDVLLSERYAYDQLASIELMDRYQNKIDHKIVAYHSAQAISDALKINWENLKWFSLKRWKYKRKFRAGYLVKNLTAQNIQKLITKVHKLEGSITEEDETKKKKGKNSVSVLAD